MNLEIISYGQLIKKNQHAIKQLEAGFQNQGIVGIKDVPDFLVKVINHMKIAKTFSLLSDEIKQQYAPNREKNVIEGYELGSEWFKDHENQLRWQVDTNKASYYALIPDYSKNIWPKEVELRKPYIELGELIFSVGKIILNLLGLNEKVGLNHKLIHGCARMLHYQSKLEFFTSNENWCGSHADHGLLTGLIPSHYYCGDEEIEEPEEAGLYVKPFQSNTYEKVGAKDKSILFYQIGEFSQLISNDRLIATQHLVKKAYHGIERHTFALFFNPDLNFEINSSSFLTKDDRYRLQESSRGAITYAQWQQASYERYRVTSIPDVISE